MILEEIFARTRADLELLKQQNSLKELEKQALNILQNKEKKDVFSCLKKQDQRLNIIAEVKKASPSKGIIRENFKPLEIAKNYDDNHAAAISVLTEPHYFKGNLNYLEQISKQVKAPLLRKDFIFDAYQLFQSVVFGADFVLLIAKMLDFDSLKGLFALAKDLNLEVLFEVHSLKELEAVLSINATIIGVNHRNLDDFSMDMKLCETLLPYFTKESICVAESGLDDKKKILELDELGVDAFLIGEYFMRETDEAKALKELCKRA